MSTLRASNLIHGTTSINNIVLDGQGRAIFGPNSSFGRAALYVDPQTNRIGVNKETPTVALDVDGSINATGSLNFSGTLNLTADLAVDTNTLYVNSTTNRVGLKNSSPQSLLQIGSSTPDEEAYITFGKTLASTQTNLPVIGQTSLDGVSNDLAIATRSSTGKLLFYTGAATVTNIGIGTSDNKARLQINEEGQLLVNPNNASTGAAEAVVIYGYGDSNNILKVYGADVTAAPFTSLGINGDIAYVTGGNNGTAFCNLALRCTPATGVEATELFISSNDGTYAAFFGGDASSNVTNSSNNVQVYGGTTNRPRLSLITSDTSIGDTAELGRFNWWNNDGGTYDELAYMRVLADQAFSAGNKGSRITWGTTANGATTPTDHMILSSAGDLTVSNVLNVREAIDLADNDVLRFGSGDDCQMVHDGSHFYIKLLADDDLIIKDENNDVTALRLDSSARRLYVQDNIYAGYNLTDYNSGTSNAVTTYCRDAANQAADTWTAYASITADFRGNANETTTESTHHFISEIKDRAGNRTVINKLDVNGSHWAFGSVYAGRTQNSTTSTATNYYQRTGNGYGFHSYNSIPYATGKKYGTTYRAYIKMSAVFDDADDRKALYGIKSDADSVIDYDADQYLACSAMGRFDVKGGIRSGRVESDEASPNQIYAPVGWGGGTGILSYTTNSNSYTAIYGRTTANTDPVLRVRVNQSADKVRIQSNGQAYTDGAWNNVPADYAEYFEWEDGNLNDEDRRGLPVVLVQDGKIRIATTEDDSESIIGVISAYPAFVGDAAELSWHGMYEKDSFGKPVEEDELWLIWNKDYKDGLPINQPIASDPDTWGASDGFPLSDLPGIEKAMADGVDTGIPRWAIAQNCIVNKPKQIVSSAYDASKAYIPRSERKEWDTVGLIGKLPVVKGSPIGSRWIKMGELSDTLDRYFVR